MKISSGNRIYFLIGIVIVMAARMSECYAFAGNGKYSQRWKAAQKTLGIVCRFNEFSSSF